MHELALSSAVTNTVCKHAKGRKVTAVHLEVGKLRQVVIDTLEFYFEITARDSVCEGAKLTIEHIPGRLHCGTCDEEWEIEVPAFVCPRCGPNDVKVIAGEEFQVESIEVEEEEPACTAPR